jgi:phosphomannomutase
LCYHFNTTLNAKFKYIIKINKNWGDLIMDPSIFKAYDIRGIYPKDLNEETAYKLGKAFVVYNNVKEVVIGRDLRKSSDLIYENLSKGIIEQGANVIDIGISSTPMFYFAARTHESGIMITASHNPAKYNGFKMCKKNAIPIYGEMIQELKNLILKNEFYVSEKGNIIKKDIIEDFIKFNLSEYDDKGKELNIVIDAGNGMAGFTYPKVFDKINTIKYTPLYFDIDLSFPNHEANPLKLENVKDLIEIVIKEKADFGVAIDGDCDRCMFIDEKGNYISADLITALIGQELLKNNKGKTILYDLRSSWSVKEALYDGNPIMCRVGHAFIKQQMRQTDAIFAGELSGHFYYKELANTESSIITILKIAELVKNKPLSELIKPLKKYYASGEINFEVENKDEKMKEIAEIFKDGNVLWLDGIKIEYNDFWFNIRASNTEPLLRLNLEAKTKEKMEEMLNKIKLLILK